MGITDIFKKKKKKKDIDPAVAKKQAEEMMGGQMPEITDEMIDQMLAGDMPGMPKMGQMQKMALRGLKKMSPEKRQEVFAQAFAQQAEGGEESAEEMLKQVEEMRAAGQLNSKQYKIAKKRIEQMAKKKN
jgi:spore coat protein CotF